MSGTLDMTARELVEEELIHGALRREQLWKMIGLGGAGFGVLGCLAAAAVALMVETPPPVVVGSRIDFVAQFPLLKPLDMSDAVCRPDICRAVEGNVLLYHDSHHLSATYMRTMTGELGRQVGAATGWW